jgi:hypothetical protein
VIDVPVRTVDEVEERILIFPQYGHAESFADFDRLVDLFEVDDLVPQDADYVLQPLFVDNFAPLPRVIDAYRPCDEN